MTLRLVMTLAIVLLGAVAARADDWTGNWDSNYGQLRLIQEGVRLYGDYADNGTIEGIIGPDRKTAHAVFYWNNGQWGTVFWRRANDRMVGVWNWSKDGLPELKSRNRWTATRTASRVAPLKFASQIKRRFPEQDVNFTEGQFLSWLSFNGSRNVLQENGNANANSNTGRNPRTGLSRWYGGYDLVNVGPAFEISADVIHYQRQNTASIDLSIYARPGGQCPQTMHLGFCRDLVASADARGFVDVKTSGVGLLNPSNGGIGEEFRVAFRLSGDSQDRLLVLRRDVTSFSASIHHPQRGWDYDGFATARTHICETSQCMRAVFDEVRRFPNRFRKGYNSTYLNRIYNLPNSITASRRNTQVPAPAPGGGGALEGTWGLYEETGESLGYVTMSGRGRNLQASGNLANFFVNGASAETRFSLAQQTDEAAAFDLTTFADGSGERKTGRLIVEFPRSGSANPRGTLIVADEVLLVELNAHNGGVTPNWQTHQGEQSDPDPDQDFDNPGFGIYKFTYRLRGVPPGRAVALRAGPSRSESIVRSLSGDARALQLNDCDPDVDNIGFEAASRAAQLSVLDARWCEVVTPDGNGWLPGRYLQPEQN
ncbi:hypothetical protein ROS1_27730 [Roseibium sp. ROS1]